MNNDRNDLLRQVLRDGDPAEGDPGLTLDEIRAMRRTVLTAIPETPRRIGWVPFLVTGAAAMITLLIVIFLGPDRNAPESPKQMAVHPAPPPAAETPAVKVENRAIMKSPERPPQQTVIHHARQRRHPVRPPEMEEMEPAPPESPVLLAASTELREIQFSTPGGTRIIWVVGPDNAL